MTLKQKVEVILQDDPESRNSDRRLCMVLWYRFHPDAFEDIKGVYYLCIMDYWALPTLDTMARARRIIQNTEGKYLPTDPEVAKRRGINEELMRLSRGEALEVIA